MNELIKTVKDFKYKPNDPDLKHLMKTTGMVGPGTRQLLNKICSKLDGSYLEIGTFQGASIIAAAYKNKCMCYGVDRFLPEFESNDPKELRIKEKLQNNIKLYKNIKIIEQSSDDFLATMIFRSDIVPPKVFFYDGDHDYKNTAKALEEIIPILDDEALVIVDDTHGLSNNNEPNQAIKQFIKTGVYEHVRDFSNQEIYYSGQTVLSYKRIKEIEYNVI